jgi:hypothetical protein
MAVISIAHVRFHIDDFQNVCKYCTHSEKWTVQNVYTYSLEYIEHILSRPLCSNLMQ